MMLPQREFDDLLADAGKRIEGDIIWLSDARHPGAMAFRVEVLSDAGHPLFIAGWYRPEKGSLCYTLVYRGVGRIYGMDFGHTHRNPSPPRRQVGVKHKHYWTEAYRAGMAYIPGDITEPWYRPVAVWRQFCAEARIVHYGIMYPPD